jgi:hypothetical protein
VEYDIHPQEEAIGLLDGYQVINKLISEKHGKLVVDKETRQVPLPENAITAILKDQYSRFTQWELPKARIIYSIYPARSSISHSIQFLAIEPAPLIYIFHID